MPHLAGGRERPSLFAALPWRVGALVVPLRHGRGADVDANLTGVANRIVRANAVNGGVATRDGRWSACDRRITDLRLEIAAQRLLTVSLRSARGAAAVETGHGLGWMTMSGMGFLRNAPSVTRVFVVPRRYVLRVPVVDRSSMCPSLPPQRVRAIRVIGFSSRVAAAGDALETAFGHHGTTRLNRSCGARADPWRFATAASPGSRRWSRMKDHPRSLPTGEE